MPVLPRRAAPGSQALPAPRRCKPPPPELSASLGAGPAAADEPQLPASAVPAHVEEPAEGMSGVDQSGAEEAQPEEEPPDWCTPMPEPACGADVTHDVA